MTYIVVGIVVWVAVAIAVALILGKAIHLADLKERRSVPRLSGSLVNTITRL